MLSTITLALALVIATLAMVDGAKIPSRDDIANSGAAGGNLVPLW